ncbi:MAG: DUF4126 domain-containing protein [Syntrophomonadaceae bacterium]|jgi:hypothetical protein|nr:DUF4126 domain-containing protein [Syntrophomonadaceae bacterium]
MEIFLNVLIGIGLAATCGFRIFVPLLITGIAGVSGYLNLSSGFEWIASYPALVVFMAATVIEVIAYFFPFIDNLLNTISTPISVIAGVMLTAAVMTDINPILQWTLAIIAGGGAASATSLVSNGTHHASTIVSGGIANPFISAVESIISVILPVLAIAIPVLAFILFILLLFGFYKILSKLKSKIASVRSY